MWEHSVVTWGQEQEAEFKHLKVRSQAAWQEVEARFVYSWWEHVICVKVDCTSSLYKCGAPCWAAPLASSRHAMNTRAAKRVLSLNVDSWDWCLKCFPRGEIGDGWRKSRNEVRLGDTDRVLRLPPPHSGYSLCVGAVPSLQRSQPGSERPELTAERCMQRNNTSTESRQKAHTARGPPWHLLCWNFSLTFGGGGGGASGESSLVV